MDRITAIALALALLALTACGEEAPKGPSTQDFSSARKELADKEAKRGSKERAVVRRAPAATQKKKQGGFASVEKGYRYESRGKRDPFRSFEWEQLKLELSDDGARGPLEQFDVNQLTIVGVVWNNNNARALVQDPAGMSYIVAPGARIGKNEGRVTQINDNLVVVRETYVDYLGEETNKDVEMRIRGTEGG